MNTNTESHFIHLFIMSMLPGISVSGKNSISSKSCGMCDYNCVMYVLNYSLYNVYVGFTNPMHSYAFKVVKSPFLPHSKWYKHPRYMLPSKHFVHLLIITCSFTFKFMMLYTCAMCDYKMCNCHCDTLCWIIIILATLNGPENVWKC